MSFESRLDRRTFLASFAVAVAACRKKPKVDPPPPRPPRPSDVLGEIVVRDPPGTWSRVRALVGLVALTLPQHAFDLVTRALALPGLAEKIEPSRPLIGVVCGEKVAIAWGIDDPAKLSTYAPERFELAPAVDSIRWLRPKAGAQATRIPLGVRDRFLLAGSSEAAIAGHDEYLLKGLALDAIGGGADIVVEVTPAGAGSAAFAQGIAWLDPIVASLADKDPSAPSDVPRVATALAALLAAAKKRAMRLEIGVTATGATLLATPSDGSAKTMIEIPDTAVRWWIRKRISDAL